MLTCTFLQINPQYANISKMWLRAIVKYRKKQSNSVKETIRKGLSSCCAYCPHTFVFTFDLGVMVTLSLHLSLSLLMADSLKYAEAG